MFAVLISAFVYTELLRVACNTLAFVPIGSLLELRLFTVYRLLTSAFVHGGLLHVAFNMLAFVPIGTSLERMQGTLALAHLIALLLLLGGGAYVGLATAASYIPWT